MRTNKLFRFFLFITFALTTSFAFTACSDDDDNVDYNNLTPTEQKATLENIAIEFLNQINPADYQVAVATLTDFVELMGTSGSEIGLFSTTASLTKSLAKVAETRNTEEMSKLRALSEYNSGYYNSMYGTYTWNSTLQDWVQTANSSALEFIFPSQGKTAKVTFSISSEYFTQITEGDVVYIPKRMDLKLLLGNSEIISYNTTVEKFDVNNGIIKASATFTIAGISYSVGTDVSSTNVSYSTGIKSGNKTLIASSVNLATGQSISTEAEADPYKLGNAVMTINILDRAFFKAECANVGNFAKKMEQIEADYPEINMNSQTIGNITTYTSGYYSPEGYYKEATKAFNEHLNMYMNYDNSSTQAIKVLLDYKYDVVKEEYYYGSKYKYIYYYDQTEIIPILQFTDGSKHKFDEYFTEDSFGNLFDKLNSLATEIENMYVY